MEGGRVFKHPELSAWVKEHRASLVTAALTIMRAWIVAKRPECGISYEGFEAWACVPRAILWATGENILEARLNDEGDPEAAGWTAILEAFRALDPEGGGLTIKQLHEGIAAARPRNPRKPRDHGSAR